MTLKPMMTRESRLKHRSGAARRQLVAALLAAFVGLPVAAAAAHGGSSPKPTVANLATAWEFDPLFLLPAALVVWAYVAAVRTVNRHHPASPVPRRRVVCFGAGMLVLALAVMSPIARYDTDLFAVHMVQHLMITLVAAPLLLGSAPITLALRAASPRVRKDFLLPVLHSRVVKALSFPVAAWFLFAGFMWISHFSPLFNGALENEWLHRLEHALYLGSALLFWWPALGTDPAPWRLAHPIRILYVFLQMPQNSFLAVTIAIANRVIFPHYETVSRTWGPSPKHDQEWAGNIMWVGGDLCFLAVLVVLAIGWVAHEERAAKRADRVRAREKALAAAVASPSA